MIFFVSLYNYSLKPESIVRFNAKTELNMEEKFIFSLSSLMTSKFYELRISRPSISPIFVNFSSNKTTYFSTSDEKVVFHPIDSNIIMDVIVKGSGVSAFKNYSYIVPIAASLNQQFYGLTYPIWTILGILFLILPIILHFGQKIILPLISQM